MTDITNLTAEAPVYSGYSVCERSGRKAYPGELVKDPYSGLMVLKKYIDHQEKTKAYRSRQISQVKRPEPEDQFVSTSIAPGDL